MSDQRRIRRYLRAVRRKRRRRFRCRLAVLLLALALYLAGAALSEHVLIRRTGEKTVVCQPVQQKAGESLRLEVSLQTGEIRLIREKSRFSAER